MSGKTAHIVQTKDQSNSATPILRYSAGITLIFAVTTLLNYDLAYLTPVLSLGYIAPGVKPLKFKQGLGFILILTLVTGASVIFSGIFLEYMLVFLPLLLLAVFWIYFTDKMPMIVKLFSIISILIIPLISFNANAIGIYVATNLVINAFMAIALSQLVFMIFPWSEADIKFVKQAKTAEALTERQRYNYALKIVIILMPLLMAFYFFQLTGGLLVLIFTAILSFSPALANAKTGMVLILANILGGIFAILVYKTLIIVPNFTYLILMTFGTALFFGAKIFSGHKLAPVFSSGLSTFVLILGSVVSSDSEAGEEVWTRVLQIAIAVIYVVMAFRILKKIYDNE